MNKPLWIKQPLAVFDPGADPTQPCTDGLVVENGVIVERLSAGQQPTLPNVEEFDARDFVLLPGLINTHHHFYQTLTRAYRDALNQPLFSWLTNLYPLWRHLTPEMIDSSTRLAAAELLLSGCTTVGDHHYIYSDQLANALDIQARACTDLGVRAVLTRGSMSLGQSAGGLPPDNIVQADDDILADSERVIQQWHDSSPASMLQVALAPCSPFSVTPQLMQQTADLAQQHDVLLHTHLAETEDENEFCLQQFGARPVDHMENCGWLHSRVWFAHGIHFSDDEVQRLGQAAVGVTHCPSSNMLLASGICPVPQLQAAGVHVGLGVDGSASNDHSNLIEEVRQAMLIQRLANSNQDGELFSHTDALSLATTGNAKLLHRPLLGHLQVGGVADLALYKLQESRFSGVDDPLAGLILSGAHRASEVMVNGQWRVQQGRLVDLDLDQLLILHQQHAEQLRRALN